MFDPSKDDALARVGKHVQYGAYGAYNFNFISDIHNKEVVMTLVRPVLHKDDATLIYSQDVISGMALTNSIDAQNVGGSDGHIANRT